VAEELSPAGFGLFVLPLVWRSVMSLPSVLPIPPPSTATSLRRRTDLTPHLPDLAKALEQQRSFRVEQIAELTEVVRKQTGVRAQVVLALRRSAVTALAEIDSALRLMEIGEYGRCRVCATALPLSRLEVLPAATLCMECQRQHECTDA
jgi:RNA polymerase-binding transcription factor DksA